MVQFNLKLVALLSLTEAVLGCTGPKVNEATLNLVEEFEGFRASVYGDPDGHQTIGYGHLCTKRNCAEVTYPKPLSKADAKKLLIKDLTKAQNCITDATANPVTLNANQYGALVSWTFNEGCHAAATSSLVARLNKGENPKKVIEQELPQWNRGDHGVLPGLTRRRKAEVKLADTATKAKALPAKC